MTEDRQRYDSHFLGLSKMLTTLLRLSNDDQIRRLRRNRVQGDVILIDFLQSEVVQESQVDKIHKKKVSN